MVILNRTLRQLRRETGFTLAVISTLALGIAANVVIFSLVYAALLRPLPYKQADRLAILWASIPSQGHSSGLDLVANDSRLAKAE
jgi:hypothetical protein